MTRTKNRPPIVNTQNNPYGQIIYNVECTPFEGENRKFMIRIVIEDGRVQTDWWRHVFILSMRPTASSGI